MSHTDIQIHITHTGYHSILWNFISNQNGLKFQNMAQTLIWHICQRIVVILLMIIIPHSAYFY